MTTEHERASRLARLLGRPHPAVVVGNGDDAAVLALRGGTVLTSDAVVAGIDFADWAPWGAVGHKVLAENLSDLAAMGATPVAYLLVLALPKGFPDAALEDFARGCRELADVFSIPCVGGDLSATAGPVTAVVTAVGELARGHAPLVRGAARPGDGIYVSGSLGGAAAGLAILQSTRAPHGAGEVSAASAQLRPVPRVALGVRLVGVARACIDVSDGLVQDLCHVLVASRVGARIDIESVPRHIGVASVAAALGRDPQALVLSGGEDFELLFTAPFDAPARAAGDASGCPVTRIGTIVDAPGLTLGGIVLGPDDVARLDAGHAPVAPGAGFLRGFSHPT